MELHDSRVSQIDVRGNVVSVHFSHAYIHKSTGTPGRDRGTGWSQAAWLTLFDVTTIGSLPPLPNTIAEGFLQVGGIKHQVLPLPFRRKVGAELSLVFVDGSQLQIVGHKPFVELLGAPIFLEDFP